MVNKRFVISKYVIDVFHNKLYIPTIYFLFHIDHVRVIRSMECGKTINYYFQVNYGKRYLKLKKYYAEKLAKIMV